MFNWITPIFKPKKQSTPFTPSKPLTWWIDDLTHKICGLVDDPDRGLAKIPWPDCEKVYLAVDKTAYDELKKENEKLKSQLVDQGIVTGATHTCEPSKSPSELYTMLRNGDRIETSDLEILHDLAHVTVSMLSDFGETFRLARNELNWVVERSSTILNHRRDSSLSYKYISRPVIKNAFLFAPSQRNWPDWAYEALTANKIITHNTGKFRSPSEETYMIIKTLEGDMRAEVGDYIIQGLQGEIYACKPDIFVKTYSPLEGVSVEIQDNTNS